MEAKITEITIQVGANVIKLTLDEAKQLFNELNSLFNKPFIYYPMQIYPTSVYTPAPSTWWITQATCGNHQWDYQNQTGVCA